MTGKHAQVTNLIQGQLNVFFISGVECDLNQFSKSDSVADKTDVYIHKRFGKLKENLKTCASCLQ